MASDLFDQMYVTACKRDEALWRQHRALWEYGVHSLSQCGRMSLALVDLGAAFVRNLEATAVRAKCRIRPVCAECGSFDCPGALNTPDSTHVFTHDPVAYAKAWQAAHGY